MIEPAPWSRVLQLADSAFPSGGFAHSGGLEAAMRFGGVDDEAKLEIFVHASVWNAARTALPFVAAAHDAPALLWEIDRRLDVQLTNHVANRASRTQGRAFLGTCSDVFDLVAIAAWAERARVDRAVAAHLAPVWGACLSELAVSKEDALRLFLHCGLRGVVSAAVRLGIVGPHAGQRLQGRQGATLERAIVSSSDSTVEQAASTAPVLDLLGALHDRLYARLFQS